MPGENNNLAKSKTPFAMYDVEKCNKYRQTQTDTVQFRKW